MEFSRTFASKREALLWVNRTAELKDLYKPGSFQGAYVKVVDANDKEILGRLIQHPLIPHSYWIAWDDDEEQGFIHARI